jgi:hypothetical protein
MSTKPRPRTITKIHCLVGNILPYTRGILQYTFCGLEITVDMTDQLREESQFAKSVKAENLCGHCLKKWRKRTGTTPS